MRLAVVELTREGWVAECFLCPLRKGYQDSDTAHKATLSHLNTDHQRYLVHAEERVTRRTKERYAIHYAGPGYSGNEAMGLDPHSPVQKWQE